PETQAAAVSKGQPLRAQVDHFVQCVGTGQRPRTGAEEGLRMVGILEALQRALKQGTQEKVSV
ncbi:MAG: hypothetical protein LC624_08845, partial [Halobacteriales archaeon]|nr:hypothetical protein [Halobacteriales archaeon]